MVYHEADQRFAFDSDLLGGLCEVGQQVAVYQVVEVFCLWLHDLLVHGQHRDLGGLGIDAGLAFCDGLLCDHERLGHQLLGAQCLLLGDVAAVLPDGGEHFRCHPVGEALSTREL